MLALSVKLDQQCVEEARIRLCAADAVLGKVMDVLGPCDISLREAKCAFSALAEIIVYQQLSPAAAQTIWNRLNSLAAGNSGGFDHLAFSLLTDDQVRNAGVSRAKLSAMRNTAQAARSGSLPSLEDASASPADDVRTSLLKIKGIGAWSVDMFLIHYAGHPDVLPLQDSALLRSFERIYGVSGQNARETLADHSLKWAPFRSIASRYLWAAVDSPAFRQARR